MTTFDQQFRQLNRNGTDGKIWCFSLNNLTVWKIGENFLEYAQVPHFSFFIHGFGFTFPGGLSLVRLRFALSLFPMRATRLWRFSIETRSKDIVYSLDGAINSDYYLAQLAQDSHTKNGLQFRKLHT